MKQMKARITFSTKKDGFLEIFVNEAGRDLLVAELNGLNKTWDHFHFEPEEFSMGVPVQTIAYCDGDTIHGRGKVLFRPDEWDQEHFPHVLQTKQSD